MDNADSKPIPVEPLSGQGLSVHMSYIRRDVDELKTLQNKQHTETIEKLNEMQSSYPTRKEFEEFTKIVSDHETRIRTLEKTMWKWIGIASTIGAVASLIVQVVLKT